MRSESQLYQPLADDGLGDRSLGSAVQNIAGTRIAENIRRNGDDPAAIRRLEARREHSARFLEAGVEIIAGTDCGVTNTGFDSLADELATYIEAGMRPADALRSATCGVARHLRIESETVADLLVLSVNPLRNIEALRSPVMVIKAGEIVCDYRLPHREWLRKHF